MKDFAGGNKWRDQQKKLSIEKVDEQTKKRKKESVFTERRGRKKKKGFIKGS